MRQLFRTAIAFAAITLSTLSCRAQIATQVDIRPRTGPLLAPLPGGPAPQPVVSPAPVAVPVTDVHPPAPVVPPVNPIQAVQGPMPEGNLKFDAEMKEFRAKAGEKPAAEFTFNFTNVSTCDINITLVQPSCGCTTVQLPPMPWKIAAGGEGQIPVRMALNGVASTYFKNITVHSDKGQKMLMIKAIIDPAPLVPMTEDERKKNQELVKADPQAIFKGDCVKCHVQPTIGKIGKELYDTACGICHEAEHRATMVPSLHALTHDTNADFWRATITHGKPNSMMPAFSLAKGGPLSDPQITTLVDYLVATMPAKAVSTNAPQHAAK